MKCFIGLLIFTTFIACEEEKSEKIEAIEEINSCIYQESSLINELNSPLKAKQFAKLSLPHIQKISGTKIRAVADISSYRRMPNTQFMRYSLKIENIPLCQESLSTYLIKNTLNISSIIAYFTKINSKISEPTEDEVKYMIESFLRKPANIQIKKSDTCYAVDNKVAQKAVKAIVQINKLPYQVVANKEKILKIEKKFFDLDNDSTIKTQIYQKDPNDYLNKILTQVTLKKVTSTGILCSDKLIMKKPKSHRLAVKKDLNFIYPPNDNKFEQTSVFSNATIHTDWLEKIGSSSWPMPQMQLVLYEEDDDLGINNVARYTPEYDNNSPMIELGKGDGIILANLRIDPEVVSHEITHHFIYQNITSVTGESLVLHEGIADAFTMLRTKNSCLGEWICPTDIICIDYQCLRTAENSYRYDDPNLTTIPHLRSQLISGLIWDIAQPSEFDSTARVLYQTVRLLGENANYSDFLRAFIDADKTLNQGKNCDHIYASMKERGFSKLLEEYKISCDLSQEKISFL